MTMHGDGPPRSTLANLMAGIVYHYAELASRGSWTSGATYVRGDVVKSSGATYVCHLAGTSSGTGPTGTGSQKDAGGVLWAPLVFVGDRYLGQHGSTPRIVLVRGDGKSGGPGRVGDGLHVAANEQKMIAAVWADESTTDLLRYAVLEAMLDRFENIVRKVGVGKVRLENLAPSTRTNIVTWGEDMQVHVMYSRLVPRDAAVDAVPIEPVSPYDPMRPNGDTGLDFSLALTANGSR